MNSDLLPINAILIAIVCFEALFIIIYWWYKTRGSWIEWRAGQSLMALLAVIFFITGNAVINLFVLDDYAAKRWVYASMYVVMILALAFVWLTIRYELKTGHKSSQLATGSTPTVEPKKKEDSDES